MEYVDLKTNKIYGCEKYSRKWYHEVGHIVFDEIKGQFKLWQNYLFLIWMIGTTLSTLNPYMIWLTLPLLATYIGIEVYEEWWCNKFARRKIDERLKQGQEITEEGSRTGF